MIAELENTAELVLHDKATNVISKEGSNIFYNVVKRTFDIFCATLGCLLLIPIILILKVVYIASGDFHSIFLTQNRIGKNGKEFKFYKFRSMIPNADDVLIEILKEDGPLAKEYKLNKKFENDPRITPVGRFIRKTSIDELPQLINILKGDMSIIGNRPYLPREKGDMGEYFDEIVKTKPGLTGFWQCSLRSRGTFEDRLKMEKFYSNNYSLRFDMSIFFKTFSVVLKRDGAK